MQLCFIVCWIILKPILIHKLWKIDGIFQPEVPYSWCVISVNILSFAPDCRYICILVSLHSPPWTGFDLKQQCITLNNVVMKLDLGNDLSVVTNILKFHGAYIIHIHIVIVYILLSYYGFGGFCIGILSQSLF